MKKSKLFPHFVWLIVCVLSVMASANDVRITSKSTFGSFPIVSDSAASIVIDQNDASVVKITADLFANDVEMVTDVKPSVLTKVPSEAENVIIIGTIGSSCYIDDLVKAGKLKTDKIDGQWEAYTIAMVKKPFPGVEKALVVAGSDRRGTAYGVFAISEAMGVSPLYWWTDVPVERKKNVYISKLPVIQESPTIKYRGFFINDEDWGLLPWSRKTYEKELGDIGPKTYAQVCELLLRMKGNMFAPAMHGCTGAFYYHKESKVVADKYGIIITTSHCEPLLFNNAARSEWDGKRDGQWNYLKNKDVILKKMDDRVREASPYENIYTMAMRGVHDEGLRGDLSNEQKVSVLADVIADQRDVLTKYLKKPISDIPQIFVPYKETLGIYEMGLKVPDDVTIVWVDDNYGYMKRVSNPEEQKRSGGSGVYYHASYLGSPHEYLWICTTPPYLMYEELTKAYNTGAEKYWLVNIGDIKPGELFLKTFFDFACNVGDYDAESINTHQSKYLASIYGSEYEDDFQDILDEYYRLAWNRKPEYMGWEHEWDKKEYDNLRNTEFSFDNYNDAQQRLADYKRISDKVKEIEASLPEEFRPSFYELIGYQVQGSYLMNRKFLMSQLNDELTTAKEYGKANWAAEQSLKAFNDLNDITKRYNTMLGGKWNGMMSITPGVCAKYQNMPEVKNHSDYPSVPVDVSPKAEENKLEGCTVIDLAKYSKKVAKDGHTVRKIEGIGYDWLSVQLGEATENESDPTDLNGTRVEYKFSGVDSDKVTVHVYSVPFFPLYKGKGTKYGISVDKQPVVVADDVVGEYSRPWRNRVLQNSTVATAEFTVDKSMKNHTLTLTCGDPGVIIQRVVIDWGGLKKTYVGPALSIANNQ